MRGVDLDGFTLPGGGRFRLLRRLGASGMGEVFEAEDRSRGIPVALKLLRAPRASAVLGFKREFRSIAGLRHPNLVRLLDLLSPVPPESGVRSKSCPERST